MTGPTSILSKPVQNTEHAKRTKDHSYFNCCLKVSVSSLLDHWLDRTSSTTNPAKSLPLSDDTHLSHLLATRLLTKITEKQQQISEISRQISDQTLFEEVIAGGQPLIQALFRGTLNIVGQKLVEVTKLLLETGSVSASETDDLGNNLLMQTEHLLTRGLFQEAADIAQYIIDTYPDLDVNQLNTKGRSLLTYSVVYGDRSTVLTRLLLNSGSRVWPDQEISEDVRQENLIEKLATEREQSAFTWLLRSLMSREVDLTGVDTTLHLLCSAMSDQPSRMKRHVTRIMLQLGKAAAVNGPLFVRLKALVAPYWSKPQDLRFQCQRRIRRALGPKRLGNGYTNRLPLPSKLQRYVRLEERLHSVI